MRTDKIKDVAYYMVLPYTVSLRPDEQGDIMAGIEELPGCIAHGENENEAIGNLRQVQKLWIESRLESGEEVPEPEDQPLPSGKWVQRVPRSLHRRLSKLAKKEGVSLNQLVTSMLSEAVAAKHPSPSLSVIEMHGLPSAFMHVHSWAGSALLEKGEAWSTDYHTARASLIHGLFYTRRLLTQPERIEDAYNPEKDIKKDIACAAASRR